MWEFAWRQGGSGVPIMGKYLGTLKRNNQSWDWRVGACLLTPYCVPPQPPFGALRERHSYPNKSTTPLKSTATNLLSGLTIEDKRKFVEQILLGFYAEPEAMEARARQGLAYYRDTAPTISMSCIWRVSRSRTTEGLEQRRQKPK